MIRRAWFAFLLLLLLGPAPAGAEESASSFVAGLGARAAGILQRQEVPLERREADLALALRDDLDVAAFARTVLGGEAKRDEGTAATPDQLADFEQALGTWLAASAAPRLGGYPGESLVIVGEQPVEPSDVLVDTRVERRGGAAPTETAWRLRRNNGRWRIVDLEIGHASLAAGEQRLAAATLRESGMAGLIAALQARGAKLPATGAK